MNDIPDWDKVDAEISPLAKKWIETVQQNFKDDRWDVSEIGETDTAGGIGWDFSITTEYGGTIVISFEIVDSLEYEGKMLGYNISIDAVHEDGRIIADHTPHNYTDDVWTSEINELKHRTENIPHITPEDIQV